MSNIETYVKEHVNESDVNIAINAIVSGNTIPFDTARNIADVIDEAKESLGISDDTEFVIEDIVKAIYN